MPLSLGVRRRSLPLQSNAGPSGGEHHLVGECTSNIYGIAVLAYDLIYLFMPRTIMTYELIRLLIAIAITNSRQRIVLLTDK